jgi:hypothetical protein
LFKQNKAGNERFVKVSWHNAFAGQAASHEYFIIATDMEYNSAKSEAVRVEAV